MSTNDHSPDPIDMGRAVTSYNARPQRELLGLSPDQVDGLLTGNWRTIGVVRLNENLTAEQAQSGWAFGAARALTRLILERGPAPVTQGGNLNRKFVMLVLESLEFPAGYVEHIWDGNKVVDEPDVGMLFDLRETMVAAGYLRRQKGIRVTKLGREALELAEREPGALFMRLFRARMGLTGDFLDGSAVFRSFLGPALYLLSQAAADWADWLKVTDRLLLPSFFPGYLPSQIGFAASDLVVRPCRDFGLVDEQSGAELSDPWKLRVTPLFGEFISFQFDDDRRRRGLRLVAAERWWGRR